MENQKSSPIFDDISDNETDALNAKKIKQQYLKHNNNNFSANKQNNEYMGGIRGRKTFAFWTLVCLLLLLAFGNLILTLTILGVLRLGDGMSCLELVPEASSIKFFGNTDLGHVYKVDGKINGFSDVPVDVSTEENGSLLMDVVRRAGRPVNKVTMNHRGMVINNTGVFTVMGTNNEQTFSTSNPQFSLQNGADKLSGKMALTNRILSLYNRTLELKADASLNLKGNEGTRMESSHIHWSADQDLYLQSVNGSLVFNSKDGVSIDIKNIPIVQNNENSASLTTQFKLCVCIPHGKLFKIPVLQGQTSRVNCNHIKMTPSYNPCM